jgi:hypothetical protein
MFKTTTIQFKVENNRKKLHKGFDLVSMYVDGVLFSQWSNHSNIQSRLNLLCLYLGIKHQKQLRKLNIENYPALSKSVKNIIVNADYGFVYVDEIIDAIGYELLVLQKNEKITTYIIYKKNQ